MELRISWDLSKGPYIKYVGGDGGSGGGGGGFLWGP